MLAMAQLRHRDSFIQWQGPGIACHVCNNSSITFKFAESLQTGIRASSAQTIKVRPPGQRPPEPVGVVGPFSMTSLHGTSSHLCTACRMTHNFPAARLMRARLSQPTPAGHHTNTTL
jgi:hypothetical protein